MDCVLIAEAGELTSAVIGWGSAILALGFVIFVHELGHFLAAKACGVKCEKFYIGFDIPIRIGPLKLPSAFCRCRWGETEYGVGVLPLGGYVKMLGQDDNPRNQAKENERIKVRKPADEGGPTSTADSTAARDAADGAAASAGTGQTDGPQEAVLLDPRSYPAKPVWQRMIIISAGVVMNLVFAVIFGAIAYRMGANYTPCILGGTAAGDPAWVHGLKPGDQILQVGRAGEPDSHLRFQHDLQLSVTLYGAEHDMELLIRRQDGRQPQWVTIRPTDRLREYGQPAALGVRPAFTTKLSPQESSDASVKQEAGHKDFRGGDEIVAVNGQVLPRDKATGAILEYHLERVFASHMKEPVTVTVRRSGTGVDEQKSAANAPQEVQVTLPPQRMRTIGLIMEIGPLVAVRKNSPAEKAGCQVGDVLVSVAGEDVRDPFTLAERLLPRIGKELEFQVRRQGELVTLRATPVPPETAGDSASPGIPLALESLGLAFDVKSVVQAVESDLPASKAGLRTGDEILEVQFLRKGKKSGPPIPMVKRNEPGLIGKFLDFVLRRESDYTEKPLANWVHVFAVMNAVPDATLELRYRRDGTESTASLSPVASETWYYGSRSVATTPLSLVRTAESWGEAWRLGVRETGSSLKNVVAVLQRLFTGGISVKSMGGPILIVAAAGSEASHGMARLLLFLTFLSANLAVLNFLPIPALDGGHIVFLAAEGLRGKPVNERLQVTLTLIGVVGLLSLMMLVFALDIQRFLLSG